VILGLSYWITLDISRLEVTVANTRETVQVTCSFAVAFYLVMGAGLAALIATTLNLMEITCERRVERNRRLRHDGSDMQLQLICDENEETSMNVFDDLPPVAPPVYQP
jgi:hypothetical protein